MSDQEQEIILDLGPCTGCTGCHELCPKIFGWDENTDRPCLKRTTATPEEIRDAMAACPGDCIELEDCSK